MARAASCFVYGSLLADEVLHALLGRVPVTKRAELRGYRRHALLGRTYPGIVADSQASVAGNVLFHLEPRETRLLDLFEDEYTNTPVQVAVEVGGAHLRVLRGEEVSVTFSATATGRNRTGGHTGLRLRASGGAAPGRLGLRGVAQRTPAGASQRTHVCAKGTQHAHSSCLTAAPGAGIPRRHTGICSSAAIASGGIIAQAVQALQDAGDVFVTCEPSRCPSRMSHRHRIGHE